MGLPPVLANESAYAGDPYDLRVIIENTTLGTKTFAAMVRAQPSSPTSLGSFQINAFEGTDTEEGNLIVDLSLSGQVTQGLPSEVHCDLEQRELGAEPLTLVRWQLPVQKDVTR